MVGWLVVDGSVLQSSVYLSWLTLYSHACPMPFHFSLVCAFLVSVMTFIGMHCFWQPHVIVVVCKCMLCFVEICNAWLSDLILGAALDCLALPCPDWLFLGLCCHGMP